MPYDALSDPQLTPAHAIKSIRDFEGFLRQSGFSRTDAKRIAARGWTPAADETQALIELLRRNLEVLSDG